MSIEPKLLPPLLSDSPRRRLAKLMANRRRLGRVATRGTLGGRLSELNGQIDDLMHELAADPAHHSDLLMDRVIAEIHWNDETEYQTLMEIPVGSDQFWSKVKELTGVAYAMLPKLMDHTEHFPTDPHFDSTGVLIGVECSRHRADRLVAIVRQEFSCEIRRKELTLRRKPCQYRFRDMMTDDQAEEFLRNRCT